MKRKSLKSHGRDGHHLPILSLEFDRDAQAIYLTVAEGRVDHTKRISDSLFVDVNKHGKTIGIEILRVKSFEGQLVEVVENLAKTYPIHELLQAA